MKREKKSRGQIKTLILRALENKPLSVQQIGEEVKSNWATTSEVLKELIEGGEIREVVSIEKVKLYQRIFRDTYFNIPINEGQRERFKRIFFEVIEEYRRREKVPNKTQLAKSAVHVIEKVNQRGESLPMMWYLYGMIPVMVADSRQDYSVDFKFDFSISAYVQEGVSRFEGKKTDEIQDLQYDGLKNKLYKLKKEILEKLSAPKKNAKEISSLLVDFLINLDSGEDVDMFNFADEFNTLFGQFKILGKLDDDEIKRELLFAFNSLWGFIAVNQAVGSLVRFGYKRKELKDFYLGPMIESRKIIAEEKLSNLNSIYISSMPDKLPEIKLSKGASEIAEIFAEGI